MDRPRRRYLLPGRRLWQRRAVAACLALVVLAAMAAAGADAYAHWRFGQVTKVNLHQALRAPTAAEKTSENILIVGNNTRTGLAPQDAQLFGSPQEVGGARSDVTMVLHLDPAKGTASLLSIPRDLFVPLPPHSMSGPVGKIDAALNDGPENLVTAITSNLGIPIDHYVSINFDGFQSVVNALGGIDLYFPTPLRDSLSGLNIAQTGCQHLGGFQALAVVRARHLQYFAGGSWSTDPLSDLGRIRRDQAFLRVLVHEAKTKGFDNPLRAQATIASLVHQVTIDSGFSFGDMLSLLRTYRGLNPDTVPTATLPISVALNYHWKGGAYGDVDMPAEPQEGDRRLPRHGPGGRRPGRRGAHDHRRVGHAGPGQHRGSRPQVQRVHRGRRHADGGTREACGNGDPLPPRLARRRQHRPGKAERFGDAGCGSVGAGGPGGAGRRVRRRRRTTVPTGSGDTRSVRPGSQPGAVPESQRLHHPCPLRRPELRPHRLPGPRSIERRARRGLRERS
ncbi:MAG: cell envelope-related transcriptional attenuator [Actinobacteria bacterium]|nr:cell envelope-related transcriptional attenuator [Actinomycetota bacterium]